MHFVQKSYDIAPALSSLFIVRFDIGTIECTNFMLISILIWILFVIEDGTEKSLRDKNYDQVLKDMDVLEE